MKNLTSVLIILASALGLNGQAIAGDVDPKADLEKIHEIFKKRFSEVPFEEYVNGVYAIDENARSQWEDIEEFPPYEDAVEHGKELFETPFANGKSYADCFENGGIGIKQNYPIFDRDSGQVITLDLAINHCREKNGEKPLAYGKGEIVAISGYMAETSRDKKINIVIPDDPKALAAYEAGKKFFYARRGQLNLSCSTCHISSAGNRLRADVLSPALGHVTHYPVFRGKWDELGSLQRRYAGCNRQIRSKPFELQSETYRNLEYFHTYMSNGLVINGPSYRK